MNIQNKVNKVINCNETISMILAIDIVAQILEKVDQTISYKAVDVKIKPVSLNYIISG